MFSAHISNPAAHLGGQKEKLKRSMNETNHPERTFFKA
jgi:hypothetical protein